MDYSPFDSAAVLGRLGVADAQNDLDGLRALYRAWCLNVPFDNLTKTEFLFSHPGATPPYVDAGEFFENWHAHGTGGTCWPHANALYALLREAGFDARRASGSMYDMGVANHGTTLVALPDGTEWLLDNAMLTMEPLRVDCECGPTEHPVHSAEVEHEPEGGLYVHGTAPPLPFIYFRLLEREVSGETYRNQWNELSLGGPFNAGVHIRRNEEDRILALRGNRLVVQDADGLHVQELSAEDVRRHLVETFGISPELVERWAASGALEASMRPGGPMPDLPQRVRPSRR